jgi:hypothetical protein
MKIIKEFPASEPIVSMIQYNGYILVATSRHVFKMKEDETFEPLVFHAPTSDDEPGGELP